MARWFFAVYIAFWVGAVVVVDRLIEWMVPGPTKAECAGHGMGPFDLCSGRSYSSQLVKNQSDYHTWVAIAAVVIVFALWLLMRRWQALAEAGSKKKP